MHKFNQILLSAGRAALWPVLSVLVFCGCAGYNLGPTNGRPAGSQSVQINPFQNKTLEPRLSDYVSNAMRKRLQQDGSYKLDTHGDSDIIINGVITLFHRSELSFDPNDTRTVRDYYLYMTAEVTAIERSTGKVVMNRPVTGRTSIRVGPDMASAERQAVPLMAEDLARNAVAALADGTW
ncbi:MAG: hypothetical protein JWM68_2178 [Verrucomicrobiales bacterium]|nr:hypothetical protein [Verrucomicrobiales bacterium]